MEGRVRYSALLLTVLMVAVPNATAQRNSLDRSLPSSKPSHGTTFMYVRNRRESSGRLDWFGLSKHGVLSWSVEGNCDYAYGYVEMNAAHNFVNVHEMDGMRAAYGRRVSSTRWAIYTLWPTRFAGVAVRRRANRWDVLKRGRPYGHTVGPWGPPAAAALLGYCA